MSSHAYEGEMGIFEDYFYDDPGTLDDRYDRAQQNYLDEENEIEEPEECRETLMCECAQCRSLDDMFSLWDDYDWEREQEEIRVQREQDEDLYTAPQSNINHAPTPWREMMTSEVGFCWGEYTRTHWTHRHKTHGRERWSKRRAKARRAHQRAQQDNRYSLEVQVDPMDYIYADYTEYWGYYGPRGYEAVGTYQYQDLVYWKYCDYLRYSYEEYDTYEVPHADDRETW